MFTINNIDMKKRISIFYKIISLLIIMVMLYTNISLIANPIVRSISIILYIPIIISTMLTRIGFCHLFFLPIGIIIVTLIDYLIVAIGCSQLNFTQWTEGVKILFAIINMILNGLYITLIIHVEDEGRSLW